MIEFLLASAIATAAPGTSPPVRSTPPLNSAPVSSPTSKPPSAPPAVPIVYPSRSPSPTTQPNKSWLDKTWERYQDRQRNLPNN